MNPFFAAKEDEYNALLEELAPILWPGYRRGFVRTACWMCPFQTIEQWECMREVYPLMWDEMWRLSRILKFREHKGDSVRRRFRKYWFESPEVHDPDAAPQEKPASKSGEVAGGGPLEE